MVESRPRVAVNHSWLTASGTWRTELRAAIESAEPLIEATGTLVLPYDPKPESAVGKVGTAPGRDIRDKGCSDTLPLQRGPHMEVVQEGTPARVVTTIGAGEANKVFLLLGDDDELIGDRLRQPLLPHRSPVLEDGAVQKRIPVGAAVRVPPTLGMESGNR